MTEHETGIILTGPHVLQAMHGTKTKTRRLVFKHVVIDVDAWEQDRFNPREWWPLRRGRRSRDPLRCRYGMVGDTLWVRETWQRIWDDEGPCCHDVDRKLGLCPHEHIEYKSDTGDRFPGRWPDDMGDDPDCPRWRSPMFMRRWACRLTLRVTSVHVERLHDITLADIEAEGVEVPPCAYDKVPERPDVLDFEREAWARGEFAKRWDKLHHGSVNGHRVPWKSNPWVFVIGFERLLGDATICKHELGRGWVPTCSIAAPA